MNPTIYYDAIPNSPLGLIWIAVSGTGLWTIEWQISQTEFFELVERRKVQTIEPNSEKVEPFRIQILEYLNKERQSFSLPIDDTGWTEFTKAVRNAVTQIPYGSAQTYAQIASQVGKPNASRAVGRANATNPIPLVIPCHRVVGTDGHLKGYGGGGGVKTKQWLLDFEKANSSLR